MDAAAPSESVSTLTETGLSHALKVKEIKLHLHAQSIDGSTSKVLACLLDGADLNTFLHACIEKVLTVLYPPHYDSHSTVRSISLYLTQMPGVAYTTSNALDDDHKEIYLSVPYFARSSLDGRRRHELEGVLVHELVHCFQFDASGTAPTGFTEGVADHVRLKNGLAPPHWRPEEVGETWDAGYQKTAYFLAWIDSVCGPLSTVNLNYACRGRKWDESIFLDVTGMSLSDLWHDFVESKKQERQEERKRQGEQMQGLTSTLRHANIAYPTSLPQSDHI